MRGHLGGVRIPLLPRLFREGERFQEADARGGGDPARVEARGAAFGLYV